MSLNRHVIIVKGDPGEILKEITVWGEASWWPNSSLMKFVRLNDNDKEVKKGTRYRQEVCLPLAPSWEVEVENLDAKSITRKFLNGMFRGFETISFSPCSDGYEINYEMHYELQGVLNKLLWFILFRRLHDNNIEAILHNLKKYIEKR